MKLGAKNIIAIKHGAVNVVKVMRGSVQVWPAEAPPGGDPFWGVVSQSGMGTTSQVSRLGWSFLVGASPVAVNRLRVFTNGTADWLVFLHRRSDATLLASATITSAAAEWVSAAVDEVELAADTEYVISARHQSGSGSNSLYRNPSSLTIDSRVTKTGNLVDTAADPVMPTISSGNVYTFVDFGYEA